MRGPEIASALRRLSLFPGKVSFYYENLSTRQTATLMEREPLIAASVIKLPLMVEAFRQAEAGLLDLEAPAQVLPTDRVPSCGVLTYLHDGITVTVSDLVTLAIIVSDNTASNMLIDRLGMDAVNAMLDAQGMPITRLRRKLFDREAASRGLQNSIAVGEIGRLLAALYRGEIVSAAASDRMLQILRDQQLNSKMPFRFAEALPIAHKTGEDDGITHDVGIVYTEEPFVLCFCANGVDTPAFDRLIQDITWEIANAS